LSKLGKIGYMAATWRLHGGYMDSGGNMARPKADAVIDLVKTHVLTAGRIATLRCPAGKGQAFLRDALTKGLRVRVTAAGAKSYVFESKVNGKTLRRTIGSPDAWTIEAARTEANRLRVLVDQKTDPRDLDRQQAEDAERIKANAHLQAMVDGAEKAAQSLTVGAVWKSAGLIGASVTTLTM
jgi:Arm DNA-binding domain